MTQKITELTPEQEARFPEWRQKYTEKQLWTGETDRPRAKVATDALYQLVGERAPLMAYVRSPLVASVASAFAAALHWGRETGWGLSRKQEKQLLETACKKAYSRLYTSPFYQTTGALISLDQKEQKDAKIISDEAGMSRLIEETTRTVTELLPEDFSYPPRKIEPDDKPASKHYEAMLELMRECLTKIWRLRNFGNQQIAWIAHLTFLRDVCGLDLPEYAAFKHYEDLAECSGYRIMHKHFCVIADPPDRLETQIVDGVYNLHSPGGAAQSWWDGWPLYYLNGVRVSPWLVKLDEGQLDPRWVAKLDNAEERREFVRKVGVERIEYKLGSRIIDKEADPMYQLIDLRLGDGDDTYRPYLKMNNPSIDAVHIEGVPKECRTIQAALNYRNGFTESQIDPVNGDDWYQHGDVTFKQTKSTLFKPRPSKIA